MKFANLFFVEHISLEEISSDSGEEAGRKKDIKKIKEDVKKDGKKATKGEF